MKIKHPFVTKLTGLIAAKTVGSWMNTLDYKAAFYDPTADLVHENFRGRKIYLFWHEYLLFPLGLRGRANVAMLLSRHSDGEILARAAHHLGFDTVRGDPTGTFQLAASDLSVIGKRVMAADMAVLVVQEGGYNLRNIRAGCAAFFRGCAEAEGVFRR